MLEGLAVGAEASGDEAEEHVGAFYRACMDEATIEAQGLASPQFARLAEIAFTLAPADPVAAVAAVHNEFSTILFGFYSSPDKKDSLVTIATLSQGGLGLPDRDYYTDEGKAEKRTKYLEYMTALLHLVGAHAATTFPQYATAEACSSAAQQVFDLEMELAGSHFTRTQCRDPHLTYNKMGPAEVGVGSGFDFVKYLALMGKPVESLNVAMPAAVTAAAKMTASPSFGHYIVFHVVSGLAKHLSSPFVALHFDFFQKCLQGTSELKPRWKQSMDHLDGAISDQVARLYVRKHFSEQAKAQALVIVDHVKAALRERLGEIEWMSAPTKLRAFEKLDSFTTKIGFPDPDAWTDYSNLVLGPDHLSNVLAARRNLLQLDIARMGAPTDKKRWHMSAHQVNAYYHPLLNEIVFPSAILQAPFFDTEADLAVQFGTFGTVVAHEITHGFDDQGRKYDAKGNLTDWWTEEDAREYERRKAVMVEQANAFTVFGLNLNGNLTTGENIADLGGIRLSLRALQALIARLPEEQKPPLINGFTPVQRFFLAWSMAWRGVEKEEYQKAMLTVDPHGPKMFRANAPLSNTAEFHEAFGVTAGMAMWRAPEERVDIW